MSQNCQRVCMEAVTHQMVISLTQCCWGNGGQGFAQSNNPLTSLSELLRCLHPGNSGWTLSPFYRPRCPHCCSLGKLYTNIQWYGTISITLWFPSTSLWFHLMNCNYIYIEIDRYINSLDIWLIYQTKILDIILIWCVLARTTKTILPMSTNRPEIKMDWNEYNTESELGIV